YSKLNKFPVFNINDDLNDLCTSAVSPNTTKATRYALNVWRYWCMTNGLKDHTDITKIPAVKLNELLENFYVTVKKSDGSDFLATSLHAIRRGLDRILKNAGVGFSITSSTFSSSTKKLKEKLWVLSKAGMSGARSRNIIYFSLSDEEEMWQAGCLGDDSPITLLSTVVKYNSQYLNMRTLQEHADLMYGDIELLKDLQNQPYFARTDSVKRESRSGSTRVCHGKIYHEHSRGHKQCPYCLLYKYMYIHRPPTQMETKSPFYLTARKEATDTGSVQEAWLPQLLPVRLPGVQASVLHTLTGEGSLRQPWPELPGGRRRPRGHERAASYLMADGRVAPSHADREAGGCSDRSQHWEQLDLCIRGP
ncbi:hypothetical protein MC885_008567, partial [Smutsia gigantea]